jgi:hypothetical protein
VGRVVAKQVEKVGRVGVGVWAEKEEPVGRVIVEVLHFLVESVTQLLPVKLKCLLIWKVRNTMMLMPRKLLGGCKAPVAILRHAKNAACLFPRIINCVLISLNLSISTLKLMLLQFQLMVVRGVVQIQLEVVMTKCILVH